MTTYIVKPELTQSSAGHTIGKLSYDMEITKLTMVRTPKSPTWDYLLLIEGEEYGHGKTIGWPHLYVVEKSDYLKRWRDAGLPVEVRV